MRIQNPLVENSFGFTIVLGGKQWIIWFQENGASVWRKWSSCLKKPNHLDRNIQILWLSHMETFEIFWRWAEKQTRLVRFEFRLVEYACGNQTWAEKVGGNIKTFWSPIVTFRNPPNYGNLCFSTFGKWNPSSTNAKSIRTHVRTLGIHGWIDCRQKSIGIPLRPIFSYFSWTKWFSTTPSKNESKTSKR